jgi:predicted DNA-binding antitoxin AbrB/MazE fold protein
MAKTERYVVEGTWSTGNCIVLRLVTKHPKPFEPIKSIQLSDGSTIKLSMRKMLERERVEEIRRYKELVDRAIARGLEGDVSIDQLREKKSG